MAACDLLTLYQDMGRNGVSYCYSGGMTEEILFGIGNAIRDHLRVEKVDPKTSRRIFAVFVEQMQNVIRYSLDKVAGEDIGELSFGILAVGVKDDNIFVSCGNFMDSADVTRLRSGLDRIRAMDRTELKAMYKDILRGETPEGSKGAGVGFIDIALKADGGIEYEFAPVSGAQTFFTLKAYF